MSSHDHGNFQKELGAALEAFRLKLREDMCCELEGIKQALNDVKLELSSGQQSFHADNLLMSNPTLFSTESDGTRHVQSTGALTESDFLKVHTSNDHYAPLAFEDTADIAHRDMQNVQSMPFATSPSKWPSHSRTLKKLKDNNCKCTSWNEFVTTDLFEYCVGLVVVLNVFFIGIDTEVQSQYQGHMPVHLVWLFAVAEALFAGLFLFEWVLRVHVFRWDFLWGENWSWNIFNTIITLLQVMEQVLIFLQVDLLVKSNVLRMLRLVRIVRIMRLLRSFAGLATLMHSIVVSVKALKWAMLFMIGTLYGFSIFLTQRVVVARREGDTDPLLPHYFADVSRTSLTLLECMLGGMDWDTPLQLLFKDVDTIAGAVFLLFNTIGLLILVNVVTGEFVEKSVRAAQSMEDKTFAEDLAVALGLQANSSSIFGQEPSGGVRMLDFQQFKDTVQNADSQLHRYFESIDLPVNEAQLRKFFDLLDDDGSGCIETSDLYDACLKLRGPVRMVDMALQSLQHKEMLAPQVRVFFNLERHLSNISDALNPKARTKTRKSGSFAL